MEVREALKKRRSIRKFTETPVFEKQIEELLHAAMSGPSACNRTPWEFYVVTDKKILEELQGASMFSKVKAPLAIIVCGNLLRDLPGKLANYWIQDCSAATENILLAATEMELGCVWCGIYPQERAEERVTAILGLPEKQIPLNIIYIGHPDEKLEGRDQYQRERVHFIR